MDGPSDLLLLVLGLSWEEFVYDPTVDSSLLELMLMQAASSTPIGLGGTNGGAKLLPKSAEETLIKDKSLISSRHFKTLSCKMKNPTTQ